MKKLLLIMALMSVSGKIFTMPAGSAGKQKAESTKQEAWESFKKLLGGLSQQDKKLALDYLNVRKAMVSSYYTKKTITGLHHSDAQAKNILQQAYNTVVVMKDCTARQRVSCEITIDNMIADLAEKEDTTGKDGCLLSLNYEIIINNALKYVIQDLEKTAESTAKPVGGPALESAAAPAAK